MHTTSVGPEVSLYSSASDKLKCSWTSMKVHVGSGVPSTKTPSGEEYLRCFVGLSNSASVGNCVAEIEGDTAPEEHPPRMHWELPSSVQGQNAQAHLGANLLRIWDDGCFYDSEAYSVSNCVDL